MPDYRRVLDIVAASEDPDQLRQFMENAKRMEADEVYEAAFRRLTEILPHESPGPIDRDFWRSIHALEQRLREERGKTVRLTRTRQKLGRVGAMQTLSDLALSATPSDGFEMLIERGMADLTAEAVILRHQEHFEPDVIEAARLRLDGTDLADGKSAEG